MDHHGTVTHIALVNTAFVWDPKCSVVLNSKANRKNTNGELAINVITGGRFLQTRCKVCKTMRIVSDL